MPADQGSEHVRLLNLDRALEALASENPSLAQVVEMHYFGGMKAEEAALALSRSVHAVRHDNPSCPRRLRRELSR